jgi:hypothetical protein
MGRVWKLYPSGTQIFTVGTGKYLDKLSGGLFSYIQPHTHTHKKKARVTKCLRRENYQHRYLHMFYTQYTPRLVLKKYFLTVSFKDIYL